MIVWWYIAMTLGSIAGELLALRAFRGNIA
jgi:hypothetical protein